MSRALSAVTAVVITLALGACVSSRSDFSAISGKNVNLSNFRIDRSKSKGRVSGSDCTQVILIIPNGSPPTLDEALDRALEPKRANLLLDAVVEYSSYYIPYIYGETCWKVEGEAYDTYE